MGSIRRGEIGQKDKRRGIFDAWQNVGWEERAHRKAARFMTKANAPWARGAVAPS